MLFTKKKSQIAVPKFKYKINQLVFYVDNPFNTIESGYIQATVATGKYLAYTLNDILDPEYD